MLSLTEQSMQQKLRLSREYRLSFPSFPSLGIPTESVLSQSFDVTSHQTELIRTQMMQVIPCEDPCLVQIIEEYPTRKQQWVMDEICK